MKPAASATALLIVDLQAAIDDPSWASAGPRNNPEAERNIARLLAHWRGRGMPVIHVRHESREPGSTYRPGQPGFEFKPATAPRRGETVVTKHVPDAFIGTQLLDLLRSAAIGTVVVTGVITNNSVEATARTAGNLGFATCVVSDATATFARRDHAGRLRTADEVHAMSLANLDGEYARIQTTAEVLATS